MRHKLLVSLRSLLLFAVVIVVTQRAMASDVQYVPQPSCGPSSVMSWLILNDQEVGVSEVAMAFHRNGIADVGGSVSAADILAAITTLGGDVEAVRWPIKSCGLALLPLPAIVHLQRPDGTGHFTVAVRVDRDRVWLVDASQSQLTVEVSIDSFLKDWTGIAIVSSNLQRRTEWFIYALLGAFLAMCISILYRLRGCWRFHKQSVGTLMLVLATLIPAGCSKLKPKLESVPLLFVEPSRNLGVVHEIGSRVETFEFSVAHSSPVTIKSIVPCCGGQLEDSSILGRVLVPGSKHSILLNVFVRDDPTPSSVFARIETEPACSVPMVIAVHHLFIGSPLLSQNEIQLESTPGAVLEAAIQAHHWRRPTDTPVKLDRDKCELGPMKISEVIVSTEMSERRGTQLACDTTRISLSTRASDQIGRSDQRLRLRWSDGATHNVPVVIRVASPIRVEPNRVFLGDVPLGAVAEAVVRIRKTGVTLFELDSVRSTTEHIEARYEPKHDLIRIQLRAPKAPGRIKAEITISFRHSSFPPISVPVTAIVVSSSNGSEHK